MGTVLAIAAIASLGVSVVSGVIDLVNLYKAGGVKDTLEAQKALITESHNLQEDRLDQDKANAELAFADQNEVFGQQTKAFQGSQKQAISMAGVSLGSGSALQIQRETAQGIERDQAELLRGQAQQRDQLDIAGSQLDSEYGQYLIDYDSNLSNLKAAPWLSMLGAASNAAGPIGGYLGDLDTSSKAGVNTNAYAATGANINSGSASKRRIPSYSSPYGRV